MAKYLYKNKESAGKDVKIRKYRIMIVAIIVGCIIMGGVFYYWNKTHSQVVLEIDKPEVQSQNDYQVSLEKQDQRRSMTLLSIGNSDLYSGLNPMQLWHDYGITAFNISAAKQNMKLSYYMLKYALKVQKPKFLLIEVDQFFEKRESIELEGYAYTALSYCYPLYRHSDKWEKIKNEKFVKDENSNHRLNYLGFYDSREIKKYNGGFDYMKQTQKREALPALTKEYLPQILSLAKQNDCQVLFVEFPSQTSWSYAKYNTVYDLSQEYQIPYLDFNVSQYGTGFDWKTDSRDGGNHLNYYGARKMTKYIGEYLQKHYMIEDDRKNPEYQDYEDIYKKYQKNFMK